MLRGSVAVAMSGGVDSAVAALLLGREGRSAGGFFMRTWNAEDEKNPVSECPWKTDMDDAKSVCEKLGIGFEVVNMISHYRQLVAKELIDGYGRGITPNPDVLCNARIKFGLLKRHAHARGFEHFATGHYCRTVTKPDGTVNILEGIDKGKDQSYFLALLNQEQVRNVSFPLGELKKTEVRELARAAGLPNWQKKDSQGICFLGKVRIQDFLSAHLQDSPGEIVDAQGKVLGKHDGLFRFTVGQRHGINLPSNADFAHYVVVGKDLERNQLIVEFENQNSKLLYGKSFDVHGLSFVNGPPGEHETLLARPRYRDPATEIEFLRTGDGTARVTFKTPQRAIAPGQVIAFYYSEILVGGAVFA